MGWWEKKVSIVYLPMAFIYRRTFELKKEDKHQVEERHPVLFAIRRCMYCFFNYYLVTVCSCRAVIREFILLFFSLYIISMEDFSLVLIGHLTILDQ